MDMNLRLPSGELEKEESEQKELLNILDAEHKLHNEDRVSRDMVDVDRLHAEDDVGQSSPTADMFC